MLQIMVLGAVEVRHDDGAALTFESHKAQALLIYLAIESGRLHSRETLASMFWPDRPDSSALSNLRHTLASLRTTLGERLPGQDGANPTTFNVTSNTIQFNKLCRAQVDLQEFELHLTAADREQEKGAKARIVELNAAAQLCRGPFLEGFSVKECPEFEEWMLLRRENISLKMQKVLGNLADAQEAVGEWEQSLTVLRQLLQLDPWNESVHRKMMSLLVSRDQRSAALNQYERCRKLLLDEFGVQPEEETLQLYEQIRTGIFTNRGTRELETKRSNGKAVKALPKKLPRNPFVGRTSELARLQQSFKLALSEQGQLVFITGEAGSGKTRLAWEFVQQAMLQQSDLLIAAGRCSAITGYDDPFLPFREVLQMLVGGHELSPGSILTPKYQRRLAESLPETVKSLLAAGPDLIDSFIPRETLVQVIENIGPGEHVWQKKLEQFLAQAAPGAKAVNMGSSARKPNEAVTRMLIELARHRPLILFIDDLQWADAGSVSLLHYLAKRMAGSRIIVLGAYRPQDIAPGMWQPGQEKERHPLERVRLELQREFGEIDVSLDESEAMEFINALVDTEPNCLGMNFREKLRRQTNGNPLFMVELLRSMQDCGHLMQDPSGRWVEGNAFDWGRLPARVEAVIAERIGRLSPDHQNLLKAASVEGEIFTAEVAARVLGLPDQQVVSYLSGPLSHDQQIVNALSVTRTATPAAGQHMRLSHYRFGHSLFQKYIYNRIDPIERSVLHEATGTALEILSGQISADQALQLAWHFEQGNLIFRAAEYLLIAGKQAANLCAYSQAKATYERCLGLIQQLSDSPERDRLEIQVQLARGATLLATIGWGSPESAQAANRVMELIEKVQGNIPDSSIILALYFEVDYFNAQNNMSEALARVNLLLRQVSTGAERIYQVLGYAMAGQVYFFAGQLATGAGYLEKAIAIYQPEDQKFLIDLVGYNVLLVCQTWDAWMQWLRGYPGRSQVLSQEVIALARKQGHSFTLTSSLGLAGALLSAMQNKPEEASAYAQECLSLTGPDTASIGRILSETVLGWATVKRGELESGLALLQKGFLAWKKNRVLTMQPMSYFLLADALSLAGQAKAGFEITESALEMIERTGRRFFEAYVLWLQGEILFREQSRAKTGWITDRSAADCFERAIVVARQQQARSIELRAVTSLARLNNDAGQTGGDDRRLEELLLQFDEGFETDDLRSARELLAVLSPSL